MEIYDIQINHINKPVGFYMPENPVISYKVSGAQGVKQKSVRISVYDEAAPATAIYESGLMYDSQAVYEMPVKLKPRTRYFVKLRIESDIGEQASAQTYFETGKSNERWDAEWITISAEMKDEAVPVLGQVFTVSEEISQARVYIASAGLFRVDINDSKVGDEYLTPYCNDYSSWMQVITYDVTEQLQHGNNSIDVTLANGWYKGRFGLEGNENLYGDTLGLLLELHIEYSDGRHEVIASDQSWFARRSPYISAEIYDGVVVDYTRDCQTKFTADSVKLMDLDLADKLNSRLTDRLSLPVRVQQKLSVEDVITTPVGETVLDMGQNMVGYLEVDTAQFPDRDFTLRFFEVLDPDGNVYTENLRSAKQEYVYRSDGQSRKLSAEFTFYGFRYVQVIGLEKIWPEAFAGCVLYSDLKQIGEVESSNNLVNRLFLNALWGQRGNFVDVPTDCPQRNERLGWTGDAQVFCGTANYNMDSTAFFAKYMYDLQQEQLRRQGAVPHFVPSCSVGSDSPMGTSSAAWGDAATVIPWTTYLHSGDKSLLARQYTSMKSWLEYIRSLDTGNYLWDSGFHFGDWLALDNPVSQSPLGTTPNAMVASAYYLYSAELVSQAAGVLGYSDEEKEYADLAKNIRSAMQKEFVSPNGRIASDTQTANVIALFMRFATDTVRAASMLNDKIQANGGFLNTGFVGTAYLCRVLSDYGYNDTAYKLLLNEDYPGWLYEVKMGATTIWERWNSIKPDGSLGDVGMNSYNHYAYGAIMEWVYRNAAGIKPLSDFAGFRRIRLAPQPNPGLEWLRVSYDSACGLYHSEWKITKTELEFVFEIPFDGQAEVYLPDAPAVVEINGQTINYEPGMILTKGIYNVSYKPLKEYYITYGIDSLAADVLKKKILKQWLVENVPQFTRIPEYVYLVPPQGTLGEFFSNYGVILSNKQNKKMIEDWSTIRSWE